MYCAVLCASIEKHFDSYCFSTTNMHINKLFPAFYNHIFSSFCIFVIGDFHPTTINGTMIEKVYFHTPVRSVAVSLVPVYLHISVSCVVGVLSSVISLLSSLTQRCFH